MTYTPGPYIEHGNGIYAATPLDTLKAWSAFNLRAWHLQASTKMMPRLPPMKPKPTPPSSHSQ